MREVGGVEIVGEEGKEKGIIRKGKRVEKEEGINKGGGMGGEGGKLVYNSK